MIVQARWIEDDDFMTLPFVNYYASSALVKTFKVETLPELQERTKNNSSQLERTLLPLMEDPSKIQSVYKVLHEMPAVATKMEIVVDDEVKQVPLSHGGKRVWIDLPAGKDVTLSLHMTRTSAYPKDMKAHAPKFTKAKDEGWFIIVGDTEEQDLVALKRSYGIRRKVQQQVYITTPEKLGHIIYTVYLLCDSYLGLDYQYDLCINVVPPQTPKLEDFVKPSND